MLGMDPITLLLLALAAARITILVTRDSILEPIRHRIFLLSPPPDNARRGWEYQRMIRATRKERNLARQAGESRADSRWIAGSEVERKPGFIGSLLSCPDCAGIWVGAGVAVAWWSAPAVTELVAVPLALALAASYIARRGGYV